MLCKRANKKYFVTDTGAGTMERCFPWLRELKLKAKIFMGT